MTKIFSGYWHMAFLHDISWSIFFKSGFLYCSWYLYVNRWTGSVCFSNKFWFIDYTWRSPKEFCEVVMTCISNDTWRNINVIITPNDITTTFWRNNDVIITSRAHWSSSGSMVTDLHWDRDNMAAMFQTTFSNAFSWMKTYEFWLWFH